MVALALMSFYSATSLRHAAPTAGKPTWRLWRHARARSACAARLGKLIDAGRDVRALGAGRWGVIPTVGAGAAAAQRSVLEQQADASV